MTTKNGEMRNFTIDDCRMMELPKVDIPRGNLTALNGGDDLPFQIERIFYTYDIPSGAQRGGHTHLNAYELIVAASGSFEVLLDDGERQKSVMLNRPNRGLLIQPGIWSRQQEFSSGGICLVLASKRFEDDEYLKDYQDFLNYRKDLNHDKVSGSAKD